MQTASDKRVLLEIQAYVLIKIIIRTRTKGVTWYNFEIPKSRSKEQNYGQEGVYIQAMLSQEKKIQSHTHLQQAYVRCFSCR